MKIVISKALVAAVTNIAEIHGEVIVPANALKLEGAVPVDILDEFSTALKGMLFKDDIPRIPEIGMMQWHTEYENASMAIGGMKFNNVEVSKITFSPEPGFYVSLVLTVKVHADEERAGKLAALLKHTVKVTLEKMTQKAIQEVEDPEAAQQPQLPAITPLLTSEKLDEVAKAKETKKPKAKKTKKVEKVAAVEPATAND